MLTWDLKNAGLQGVCWHGNILVESVIRPFIVPELSIGFGSDLS
jgi:hypothetical protein